MQSRNSILHVVARMHQMRRYVRLVSTIGFVLFLALSGMGRGNVASAAPVFGFSVESVDCGSVTGWLYWSEVPLGGWVEIFVRIDDGSGYNGYGVRNLGDDADGELLVTIPFSSDSLAGWYFYGKISDETYTPIYEAMDPQFERECVVGSVSPGGTGDGEGEPIDARSDATTDPGDVSPADDPDDDGRVQVP